MSILLKNSLHTAITKSVYKDIITRSSNYYYYLGKVTPWRVETIPDTPINNIKYENTVRNNIVAANLIKPTDVSYILKRYDWIENTIYDQYDDQYDTKLKGFNLINGGSDYNTIPKVYIGSIGAINWNPNTNYLKTDFVKTSNNNYYLITENCTSTNIPPNHYAGTINGFTYTHVDDGNGTGAEAVAEINSGKIVNIVLVNSGINYTSTPTVNIIGLSGANGTASAVLTKGVYDGAQKIEDAKFYVLTNEYKIFKCLDNNNGGLSTQKPISVSHNAIKYNDGYIWKFMGIVNPALRLKFLTENYFPVMTALNNSYFSSGEITTVNIDAMGSGYTYANITVNGDGYSNDNPVYINNIQVITNGTLYENAELNITPPIADTVLWEASTAYNVGVKIQHGLNFYEVMTYGISDTTPPTHLKNTFSNGTTFLKYIGSTVFGVPIIDNGTISDLILDGNLKSINITSYGSGYNSIPTVTINHDHTLWDNNTLVTLGDVLEYDNRIYTVTVAGTTDVTNGPTHSTGTETNGTTELTFINYKLPATTTVYVNNGVINDIVITNRGGGFTKIPEVVIGNIWQPNTYYELNTQLFYLENLYTVTSAGTSDDEQNPPTHLLSTETNGTLELTYAGNAAKGTGVLKYGSGYTIQPNASIIALVGDGASLSVTTSNSAAKLSPILSNGQLIGINIIDPGIGYTTTSFTVNGDGTGAAVSTELNNNDINSLQANVELLTIPGQINCIPLISGGYGYAGTSATVTITGNGTGATASAVVENGVVTKINIINPGMNYNWAEVTIQNSGIGAKARAVIGPNGGHGKDIVNELYVNNLMFYTKLYDEKVYGYTIDNDYHQMGILKNPSSFLNNSLLSDNIISPCWSIGTLETIESIEPDMILLDQNNNKFLVITSENKSLLLQSVDETYINTNDVLKDPSNNLYTVDFVNIPQMNKYSGELLFIESTYPFSTALDQIITLRSILKF